MTDMRRKGHGSEESLHFIDELRATTGSHEDGRGLPPECYYDDDIFRLELETIFHREWMCVGRADQIPTPGDYMGLTVAGEPVIVVRDDEGKVRVLSAVCRHRGLIITCPGDGEYNQWLEEPGDTQGNCGRGFRCPYHFWTYGSDGRLIGAPDMQRTPGFQREEISLPNFRSEVWQGFIFMNLDPDARSLVERMKAVDPLVANWKLSEMATEPPTHMRNLPWNWKIMHENSIDVYHVDRLHYPRHAVLPAKGYLPLEVPTEDAAIVFGHVASHKDFALSPIGHPLFPVIESLTDEERGRSYVIFIPPTLLIILNSDSAFYRIVHARDAQSIDIRQTLMVPAPYQSLPNYSDLVETGAAMHLRLNYQDYIVDASLQRAMSSTVAPRGLYAWNEAAVAQFDNWVARRYAAGMAKNDPVAVDVRSS